MKPVWLVAAVALAAFVWFRRRRLEPPLLIAGALAVLGMAVYSTGVVELPNIDKVLEDIGRALGPWTYLLAGVLAFLEAAAFLGLILPGETAIIVSGVVAGQGQINIVVLIAVAWACAVAGDLTGYALGRRLGRPFLVRHGPRFGISEERVHQVDRFFAKHGGKAIFVGRFVGLVRSLSPFLAGSSGMPLRRFVPYDVLGAGIQSTILCLIGYIFWHSLDRVLEIAKQGALALGVTIAVVFALVIAVRWLRRAENRERITAWLRAHEHRADVRVALAAWRRARRPARFFWHRLTPGNLGLELTTLLSTGLVGGYVFFGYMLVLDDVALTPGDRRAEIWAEAVRTGVLDNLADGAQQLGSLPVVAVAVVLAAAGLLVARERLEAFVLLGALALTIVAAAIADGAIVREALTPGGEAASYPDTGGAYAVTWIALAVALRHATGPFTRSAALAVLGTVLTVAFALSSVYLRDDWFSDVAGGIGLGVLCWSVAGIAGLLVRAVD
jgi:membrane protein DedA with SNARE-associated domain